MRAVTSVSNKLGKSTASNAQAPTHTPQLEQRYGMMVASSLKREPAGAGTISIAANGQSLAQSEQPVHFVSTTSAGVTGAVLIM